MARRRKGANDKAMLAGMVAGSVIGASVALVYAPAEGDQNRKQLLAWANARVEDLRDRAQAALSGGKSDM